MAGDLLVPLEETPSNRATLSCRSSLVQIRREIVVVVCVMSIHLQGHPGHVSHYRSRYSLCTSNRLVTESNSCRQAGQGVYHPSDPCVISARLPNPGPCNRARWWPKNCCTKQPRHFRYLALIIPVEKDSLHSAALVGGGRPRPTLRLTDT